MDEPHARKLQSGTLISDDRTLLNMDYVCTAVSKSYWATNRPRELTERSWADSMCIGLHDARAIQPGFGRVLTDYALRAHVADVYVDPASRGLGLGKAICEYTLDHPALRTVSSWTLATADAHNLYARFGFETGESDDGWMTMKRVVEP